MTINRKQFNQINKLLKTLNIQRKEKELLSDHKKTLLKSTLDGLVVKLTTFRQAKVSLSKDSILQLVDMTLSLVEKEISETEKQLKELGYSDV